jgi:RimJ/RimL family protein N-acetyltransferase
MTFEAYTSGALSIDSFHTDWIRPLRQEAFVDDRLAMVDLSDYPKHVQLEDGTLVLLRPMRRDDRDLLQAFFGSLPGRYRRTFDHDAGRREVISRWCRQLDYDQVLPILAILHNGRYERVVADSTLRTERYGWSVHVAKIRWVVADDMRKTGLGRLLVRELLHRANNLGIRKVQAEIHAEDEEAMQLLLHLGFKQEAVFAKHAMDQQGNLHDIVIVSNDLDHVWQKMDDLNIDSDFCQRP